MSEEERRDTWGIEVLAAANYQSFEEVVDKQAATSTTTSRVELREALAHWVDHEIVDVIEEYDVTESLVREAADACTRAVERQYPDLT